MKINLIINNMMCANCVSTIENNLIKVSGISKVTCNLVNQECHLEYDENLISRIEIINAINSLGYQVNDDIKDVILNIDTIHCANCVATIENGLKKHDGIINVSANLVNSNARISYNENIINLEEIKDIINSLGYQVKENLIKRSYYISNLDNNFNDALLYLNKVEGLSDISIRNNILSFISDEDIVDIVLVKNKLRKLSYQLESIKQNKLDIQSINIKKFRVSFIIALIVTIILDVLSMIGMFSNSIINLLGLNVFVIIQFILCSIVLLIGRNFFINGFKALIKFHPNMDTLVSLGSGVGFIFSIYMLFKYWDTSHLIHHLYFESSATIITFILLGKYLESLSKKNASQSLISLYEIIPNQVLIEKNKQELLIDSEDLKVNDIVIVKTGDILASDGIIIEGKAELDEAIITGESLSIIKNVNDEVVMGSTNINGYFKYKVTKIGQESTIGKIAQLVNEAQASKAPIARLADVISKYFIITIIILAILAGCYWALIANKDSDFVLNIVATTLIIACPCALGLATPTAMLVSSSRASRMGILIKEMSALELAGKVNTIAFDKTGTITNNIKVVKEVNVFDNENKDTYFKIIKSLESKSEHLISKAIINYLEEYDELDIEDFEIIIGKGLIGYYQNNRVIIGSDSLIMENNLIIDPKFIDLDNDYKDNHITIYMAYNNEVCVQFIISDQIKEDAYESINKLQQLNKDIIILSGDNQNKVVELARKLNITKAFGNLLPQNKIDKIKELQNNNNLVMMVGDGVNDAPALACANVSVAIGTSTNVSIDTSDIVLINNKLNDLVKLVILSQKTITNIKQNLFWAFAYNVIMVPIAMGALYYFNGLLINPMFGAIAMSLSSLTVLSNALRLRKINIS
ncbi:MAG: heavy metal translocating P-type ATPase [Bacilli bacterium]|jgi:Cu+-exporting ATPase|nr:heavy metal translocating P-type ATPase [Bacilli bacterium]